MQTTFHNVSNGKKRSGAFTVLELLVAVSIMTLIVYGLYQMFNQTQKALRNSINQVDVLESGRSAFEIMTRELRQVSASRIGGATNLFIQMIPTTPLTLSDLDPASPPLRTNVLQEFFFLSQFNNRWQGTGYRIIGANHGVGTLYRFSTFTNENGMNRFSLSSDFVNEPITNAATRRISTNFHRLADGVVHLRLMAFDKRGVRIGLDVTNSYPSYSSLVQGANANDIPLVNNLILRPEPFAHALDQTKLIFLSNALPAYLELELGVIEPETLLKYQALQIGPANAATNFLAQQAGKVHLFRQRIPIKTTLQ